jgi:branched-chain amino acid transport system substrate-binding protein
MRARPGRRLLCVLVCVGLLSAACGTQLTHEEIVAAHGATADATGSTNDQPGATQGAGATSDTLAPATATGDQPAAATTGGPATPAGAAGPAGGGTSTGGAAPGARAAAGSEVVIGSVGTYSGVVGSIFAGGREATQAWAQSVNARGGLNGHPVKLLLADDGGDPARALGIVRDMVERQGAIAFVGNNMPVSLSGIRKYLEDHRIPLIGGDLTLPDWTQSPMLFPQGTTIDTIGRAALALMAKNGAPKMAILFCGESPSCAALTRQVPPEAQVLYTAQISLAQVDFTGECLRAKDKGVQGIFVAADAGTVLRVARSCKQQGLNVQYGTASIAVGPQLADDPNVEGLIAPVLSFPWVLKDGPFAAFANAMATYAPGVPLSAIASGQWTSGVLLEKAGAGLSAKPTSAELIAALGKVRNERLGGLAAPLTFNPGGPASKVTCYFVVKVSGGRWLAPNGSTPTC